jgi:hypothetical protein
VVFAAQLNVMCKKENMEYKCFICNEEISTKKDKRGLDPCSVTLTTNIDLSRGKQREQTFFCHIECFRKVNSNDGIMYIMESDFATIAEIEKEE